MGKRSTFKRIAKDHYPTIDPRAVRPLLPHLNLSQRYAEPCAGEGHLIDLLDPHIVLAWASDIDPRRSARIHENDALAVGIGDADLFITNPPWGRKLLHPLIVHLSDQAPTWLLFDASWANTKQAKPFMPRCRKIVAVGRLIWMEGTTTQGKDDCSWYMFDRPRDGALPTFYPQGWAPPEATGRRAARVCPDCGVLIDRFAKWSLQPRHGLPVPVHRDCARPSGLTAVADPDQFDLFGGGR